MSQTAPKFERQLFRTYLGVIENAPGTGMFRHFYLRRNDGTEFDAIGDGENACAFFVSSVLVMFAKLKAIHGTVGSTIKDLEESGWEQVKEPQPGDVLSWQPKQFHGGSHGHIGFYLGDHRAVSTSTSMRQVAEHDLHYDSENRPVIAAYRFPDWGQFVHKAKIIGPFIQPDPNYEISGWLEYILEGPKPSDHFWFAVEQNKIIGGLKLTLDQGATAHDITGDTVGIDELSVDPKHQRQGIAAALVQASEQWIRAQKQLPQTLGLGVETTNDRAIKLYKKLGFETASREGEPVRFSGAGGKPCCVMFKHL
jgi:ribosomal protein S18 acetylase RimI-like enzyme